MSIMFVFTLLTYAIPMNMAALMGACYWLYGEPHELLKALVWAWISWRRWRRVYAMLAWHNVEAKP